MNSEAVESALEVLRPGLGADGLDLYVGALDGDVVQVVLEAKPGACLDCVVPDDVLVQILESAIRESSTTLDRVELVKKGFS